MLKSQTLSILIFSHSFIEKLDQVTLDLETMESSKTRLQQKFDELEQQGIDNTKTAGDKFETLQNEFNTVKSELSENMTEVIRLTNDRKLDFATNLNALFFKIF